MRQFFTTATPLSEKPKEINGQSSLRKTRRQAAKEAARIPLKGFPVVKKFTTQKDVTEYLNGELILCLICGRSFKQLCLHISQTHQVSAEDYKIRFGLPFRVGLSSSKTRELSGAMTEQKLERLRALSTPENRKLATEAAKHQRSWKSRIGKSTRHGGECACVVCRKAK